MADDLLFCPTCGGAAVIVGGDSLRCPTCDDPSGSFGELYRHLEWGGPLSRDNAGDATLCEFRHLLRERFGGFDLAALDRLRDWLIADRGMGKEQVYAGKLTAIVAMLRKAKPAESADAADTKADTKKNLPESDRVWKAIRAVNLHRERVAQGKARPCATNAVLSDHLGEPVESKAVKNLARSLRRYSHLLVDEPAVLADN